MDENFVCQPECCQDSDCTTPGKPLCNTEGICKDGCRDDQDCDNWNGMCPGCQWCDKPSNVEIGQCKPGCLTDDQCGPNQNCVEHICKDNCLLPCQTVVRIRTVRLENLCATLMASARTDVVKVQNVL